MLDKGIVKEIIGNVSVKDSGEEERILTVNDSLKLGDTVITNSENDKISFEFNDVKVSLAGGDLLKIDQSVVLSESFGNESNVQLSSIQDFLNLFFSDISMNDMTVSIGDDTVLDFNEVERLKQVSEGLEINGKDVLAKVSPNDLFTDYQNSIGILSKHDLSDLVVKHSKSPQNDLVSESDATFSIKIDTDIQTDFS
ncbi:hypothetical protein ACHJH3_02675 [Campylobacter sp. MOP7]|uniref:hypothetical protein n=1 Tax=Campylobacter canis TaxID=3378588 RepID=UPI00387ED211